MALVKAFRVALTALAALLLAGPLSASAQTPAKPATTAPAAAATPAADKTVSLADGYVLGVGDVVEVAVLGRDEFHPRVQVQNDGTIQLPYLHSVKAQNLTVLQLRDQIHKLLLDGGYYTDPVVSVVVVTFASRYVTVLGEVANPGLLPIDRTYHLSEVMARVGGIKPTGTDEIVLRSPDGKERKLMIKDVSAGGGEQDPIVSPGDKIFVATAPTYYIYGQVGQPGNYRVEQGMTLRQAIARSGGLNERGSDKKVKVYRNGNDVGRVDLNSLVKDGDTVVVGQRFF